MSNRNPSVASGARGPIARGTAVEREGAAPARGRNAEVPVKEGFKRYRSKASGYVLQITAPADTYNPSTGQTTKHLRKIAKFTPMANPVGEARGEFETNDPQIIEKIERSRVFGRGLDIWLADDQDKAIATTKLDELARAIENLGSGDLQKELLEKLNSVVATNFQLPPSGFGGGQQQ